MITTERMKAFLPNAKPELVKAILDDVGLGLAAAGINTSLRVCHFLAQIAVETGGLRSISESLNYSVKGLRATFGQHRISDADCAKYGRAGDGHPANQEMIANIVYGGPWGLKNLGNVEPGDGWKYRGGGMLQTTGRANFKRAGHEHDPESLRDPAKALASALVFWTQNKINELADRDDVTAVRKKINGGAHGLPEAKKYLAEAKRIFT